MSFIKFNLFSCKSEPHLLRSTLGIAGAASFADADKDDENIEVVVKTLSGEPFAIPVSPRENIKSLKWWTEQAIFAPCSYQRLIFNGEDVNDRKKIKTYGVNNGAEVLLQMVGKGGAKSIKKDKFGVEKAMVPYKRNDIIESAKSINEKNSMSVEQTIKNANGFMNGVFARVGVDARASFKMMLVKSSGASTEEALRCFKCNKATLRVEKMGNVTLRQAVPDLFKLSDDVSGMVEGAQSVFDYAMSAAFMIEGGGWDWATAKRMVEDELTIRAAMTSDTSTDVP